MKHIGDEIGDIIRPLDPQPIETKYRGVLFRSRLEARWAVFFDVARIRWEYEREGFKLPCGFYLPDFWLPEPRLWVEVKPRSATPEEVAKCFALAETMSMDRVALVIGAPDPEPDEGAYCFYWHDEGVIDDHPFRFCECPKCHRVGFEFDGRGHRVCGNGCFPAEFDRGHTGHIARFTEAYESSRVARFW